MTAARADTIPRYGLKTITPWIKKVLLYGARARLRPGDRARRAGNERDRGSTGAGQVKSSSGATRPCGDHPDPNLFHPPPQPYAGSGERSDWGRPLG